MIVPVLALDSHERWWPVGVEDSLAAYGYTWVRDSWQRAGAPVSKIDLPRSMTQSDLPVAGYHRRLKAGGLWWNQFWTWWLYNPKQYAGFGAHEGDWEMVQLGCTDEAGENPVLATCAQHSGGEKREFWRVEMRDHRPRIYVARDSHAAYFTAHRDVTDQADGKGRVLDIEWREFGAWSSWPGRWGNSENSPGPLSARRAWKAPHAWHGQARG